MIKMQKIIEVQLRTAGVTGDISFTAPPKPEMGDIAFACFGLAKEWKKSPNDVALEITGKLKEIKKKLDIVERVDAIGPYVNFFLNGSEVAKEVLKTIGKEKGKYGVHKDGAKKKILVEFACPNPMKAFHLGHLRNTITGESVSRILENAGYAVVRVNYQGDVGRHIAMSLWGVQQLHDEFELVLEKTLEEQVNFLGRAYAYGAQAFEKDEGAKREILELNKKVYAKDESIIEIYDIARAWSLEYFETIYTRLGTHFDELYFESEVWERGLEIVRAFLKQSVFVESQGAVIFPGSEHGLHDRVFISSEGNATYEAKDLALSSAGMRNTIRI